MSSAEAAAQKMPATPTEAEIYALWEKQGAFTAQNDTDKKAYTIMMPPPNVTGSLHVGHALTFTLQDVLIRWKRMQGFDTLWQPGTDHAGIATQLMVERQLAAEGMHRNEIGRQAFLDRVWQWKENSGGEIVKQLRTLGASADWSRERFTMDEGLSTAVRDVFVTLFDQGLIYRARRLVNWDPKFQSAISDLEVDNVETKGSMWYIRYPVKDVAGRFITVATTRPETMLGDTAVAVNPTDERYQDLIGKELVLPITGRVIPVVADEHSDPEKGTGAVKITPAHDFNDFEVGKRHDLPMLTIMDDTGQIDLVEIADQCQAVDGVADAAFLKTLQGVDRFEARKKIVAHLEELELLEKIEPHVLQVPKAQRGGTVVEPRLKLQWFCNAEVLAKPAVEAVESGKIKFVPQQWENTFYAWMRNIQPWCISRQLWWGHRIPAWYGPDETVFVAHSEEQALKKAAAHYGKDVALTQDEDVLDTWFSSGLWPFSTLGWPEKTADLKHYYPGDVLVTGHDIIFFWVARMIMMGLHFMGDVPFHTVYMHGMVRDEKGLKMSKTTGNVVNPIDMINQYGTDALRWSICSSAGVGRDIKLGASIIEHNRSFITKLRNAANFCERNGVAPRADFDPKAVQTPLCRWLLAELDTAIADSTQAIQAYRLDDYADVLYKFTWNIFCDWFIELSKPAFDGPDAEEVRATAAYVLSVLLRLLNPAIPYVAEELSARFGFCDLGSLIHAPWPQPQGIAEGAAAAQSEVNWIIRLISSIRTVRAEMNVPHSTRIPLVLRDADATQMAWVSAWQPALERLAKIETIAAFDGTMPKGAAQAAMDNVTVILPLEGLIDFDAERARLTKEIGKLQANADKLSKQLSNENFVARAPVEIVEENRAQLATLQNEMTRLEQALQNIADA